MRIAILNWTSRPVGGVGSYLRIVIPALARLGHDVAFWHERGERPDGDPFGLPAGSPSWSVERIGLDRALDDLVAWRPDVLASHGLIDPEVEARTLRIAPAVFHVHGYHGTCISGAKTFKNPTPRPCSRRFGWPCLVNYYPRRCGGWSPITMIREFRRQSERLPLLSRYKGLVAYSAHMQDEFARHGIHVTCVDPPMESAAASAGDVGDRHTRDAWELLFVGRMDPLKGGRYLLDALPRVAGAVVRRLDVTFAGDGPARASWEAAAARLVRREPTIHIEFTGWLSPEHVKALYARADLLVVPSLWPEPFGFVGPEAGRQGLPAAAFAVGGIPDWLRPGINGFLATGDPPTARGLADAIIACLKDPETHARLCDGAGSVAAELSLDRHVDALMRVLRDAAGTPNDQGVDALAMAPAALVYRDSDP